VYSKATNCTISQAMDEIARNGSALNLLCKVGSDSVLNTNRFLEDEASFAKGLSIANAIIALKEQKAQYVKDVNKPAFENAITTAILQRWKTPARSLIP
jgi:hypothetical protein